ncbi:MAG: hypothetical protein RI932_1931 [Pseudomonadota bacterium]|jgi:dihydropteroate synthase
MNVSLNARGAHRCHALMNRTQTVHQGIVNVTPDSFSDGGLFYDPMHALVQAQKLVAEGAQIIDIGGVSTRPGATEVGPDVELQRVLPVLRILRERLPEDVLLSLDTSAPEVACAAAQENLIDIINDVFAARKTMSSEQTKIGNPDIAPTTAHVAARFALGLVVMHMQGNPSTMQHNPAYANCLDDVTSFLQERMQFANACGVQWIAVDPGIGFGKTLEHNLQLMSAAGLQKLSLLGAPVLVGLSRKSFLKMLAKNENSLPEFSSDDEEMRWRDQQSALWETKCIAWGARIIRTHVIKPVS